jgi:hypothetical protein
MSYMIERGSDGASWRRWRVVGGQWTSAGTVDAGIVPAWDPDAGRIAALIPLTALASTTPALGDAWGQLQLVLAYPGATAGVWVEDSSILIHYRLSTPTQSWIYGNIER